MKDISIIEIIDNKSDTVIFRTRFADAEIAYQRYLGARAALEAVSKLIGSYSVVFRWEKQDND